MKRLLFVCLGLIAVAVALAGALQTHWVQNKLMARAINEKVQGYRRDIFADHDALNIIFCGTGSPIPSEHRAGACIAVIADGKMYLIDSGPRSTNNLGLWRIPLGTLQAVFLTHFHSDHIASLGQINQGSWIELRQSALQVYGGPGVEKLVSGFNAVYSANSDYRNAFFPGAVKPELSKMQARTIQIESAKELVNLVNTDGLKISAFKVDHGVVKPAFGYKVEYKGRSLVISGDTLAHGPMETFAQNTDLLIHEAMCDEPMQLFSKKLIESNREAYGGMVAMVKAYHTLPTEAALIAKNADVGALIFYHFIPPMENFVAKKLFLRGVKDVWDGQTKMSFDGMRIRLPVGNEKIQYLDVRP